MPRLRFWFVLGLLLLGGWPLHAGAQGDAGLSWTVTPIYGETYRPSTWLPLRIQVSNAGADRTVQIEAKQFSTRLDVPGGGRKEIILLMYAEQLTRVRISMRDGETEVLSETLKLKPTTKPIIAGLREQPLPALRTHVFVDLPSSALPAATAALQPLTGLVVDAQHWNDLTGPQRDAIALWVAEGGTLIVDGSAANELPTDLRPASSGEAVNFSGEALTRAFSSIDEPPTDVAGTQLTPEAGATVHLTADGLPLVVERQVGSGRVLALAVAPDAAELVAWANYPAFWQAIVPPTPDTASGTPPDPIVFRDGQVPGYLNNLPALDLPPLRLLLILLAIYVVLVGPVTYLVLRRMDRMALAWITVPMLTVVFAVLAYGFGERQRGSDIIINDLAIVEQRGAQGAMLYGYAGIFSPVKASYIVDVADNSLTRPISSFGWGGPVAANTDARYNTAPSQVQNLAVGQWSMAMFAYQRPLADMPSPDLQLHLSESTIRGTLRNTTPYLLKDAALIIGGQAQKFGDLSPNEERPIEIRLQNNLQQPSTSYVLYQKELDKAYQDPSGRGPDRDLLAKTQAIDTAAPMIYGITGQREPVFLAFIDEQLSTVSLPNQRSNHTQRAVLVLHPQLHFKSGPITLDNGWMQVSGMDISRPNSRAADFCDSGHGAGAAVQSEFNQVTITLPAQVQALQLTELRIAPSIDSMVDASKLSYEIYNWASGDWDSVEYRAGLLQLPDIGPYVGPRDIRIRYSLPEGQFVAGGGWWGCFSPGVVLKGTLP